KRVITPWAAKGIWSSRMLRASRIPPGSASRSPAWRFRISYALAAGAALPLALGMPRGDAADTPAPKQPVASENETAARAALEVLKAGGNAVDAAIAASFMLGVTAPVSCGIGGGGFALVYDAAKKQPFLLDYRESAPARYDLATFEAKVPG